MFDDLDADDEEFEQNWETEYVITVYETSDSSLLIAHCFKPVEEEDIGALDSDGTFYHQVSVVPGPAAFPLHPHSSAVCTAHITFATDSEENFTASKDGDGGAVTVVEAVDKSDDTENVIVAVACLISGGRCQFVHFQLQQASKKKEEETEEMEEEEEEKADGGASSAPLWMLNSCTLPPPTSTTADAEDVIVEEAATKLGWKACWKNIIQRGSGGDGRGGSGGGSVGGGGGGGGTITAITTATPTTTATATNARVLPAAQQTNMWMTFEEAQREYSLKCRTIRAEHLLHHADGMKSEQIDNRCARSETMHVAVRFPAQGFDYESAVEQFLTRQGMNASALVDYQASLLLEPGGKSLRGTLSPFIENVDDVEVGRGVMMVITLFLNRDKIEQVREMLPEKSNMAVLAVHVPALTGFAHFLFDYVTFRGGMTSNREICFGGIQLLKDQTAARLSARLRSAVKSAPTPPQQKQFFMSNGEMIQEFASAVQLKHPWMPQVLVRHRHEVAKAHAESQKYVLARRNMRSGKKKTAASKEVMNWILRQLGVTLEFATSPPRGC